MSKLRQMTLGFSAVLMLSCLLLGQTSTGKIIGVCTDDQGSPLPGVSVLGTSPNFVGDATAISDSNGVYRLLGLSAGKYKIVFSLPGFNAFIRENIDVRADQTLTMNIQMDIATVKQEVTVTGKAVLIDVKSTTQGTTLSKEEFTTLPSARNFDSLMTVVPGVYYEQRLGGASIDGASGLENMYYFDGMNIGDLEIGTPKQKAVFDFVEEVQVRSSGYQAEFGGSLGGVVNVITRSGGDEFHGGLTGYYEGSALTGKERDQIVLNPFDLTKAEYVNYQDLYGKDKVSKLEAGFNFGGYIVRGKLWFFLSALPVFQSTTRNVKWLSGEIPSGSYTQNNKWFNSIGKISAQPFKGLHLDAAIITNTSSYLGELPSRDGSGDSSTPYDKIGYTYPNLSANLSANQVIGNNLIISARAGYFSSNTSNQKLVPSAPEYGFLETNAIYPDLIATYPSYIRAAGYDSYGPGLGPVTNKNLFSRASANIDINYYINLAGEHSLKAGFQLIREHSSVDTTYKYDLFSFVWGQPYYIPGEYETPHMGKYGYYAVSFADSPGPDVGMFGQLTTPRISFYLQDSWTLFNNKLTVNYGIRAEQEDLQPYSIPPNNAGRILRWNFADKLSPRLGVIYDVFGDSSLKIFGSFGIYYDVMKLALAEGYYGPYKSTVRYYTLDDPTWWTYGNGNYPGTLINVYTGALQAFDTTDKNMKPFSQREISFGAEKKISEHLSASVRVVRKSVLRAIEDFGVEQPEGEIWYIGNPGYGLTLNQKNGGVMPDKFPGLPKAKREYAAVNLGLEKRYSDNWLAGFSYTWSHLWGNFAGLASSSSLLPGGQIAPNQSEMFDEWYRNRDAKLNSLDGPLWTDRPHFFKLFGSYTFPFPLTIGIVANAYSGLPISRRLKAPGSMWPDGFLTDGRTPFTWTTNLLLEYRVKLGKNSLGLNLNVNNVFNAKTAQNVYFNVNRRPIPASDDDKLTGTWDYTKTNYVPDPRFLKQREFLAPIAARFGINFSF